MSRPRISPSYYVPRSERKKRSVELTLSDEAHDELDERARRRGRSRSNLVEEWLLGKNGKEKG